MRMGWARALKKSALKVCRSEAGGAPVTVSTVYKNILI
jgi:hypothetical protein